MPKSLADRLSNPQGSTAPYQSGRLLSRLSPHTPAPPPKVRSTHRLPPKPVVEVPPATRDLQDYEKIHEYLRKGRFHTYRDHRIEIYEKRSAAAIKRIQALFDCKEQLDNLPVYLRTKLESLGNKLDWIQAHPEIIADLRPGNQYQVKYFLAKIKETSFKKLATRYTEVVRELSFIELSPGWSQGWEWTKELLF